MLARRAPSRSLALVARSGDVASCESAAGRARRVSLDEGFACETAAAVVRAWAKRVVVSEDRDSCVHPHFIAVGAARTAL